MIATLQKCYTPEIFKRLNTRLFGTKLLLFPVNTHMAAPGQSFDP